MITEREQRLHELNAKIATIRTAPEILSLELRRLEKEATQRLADFKGLLGRHPASSRASAGSREPVRVRTRICAV
jgi:site-specific DNA recombinase